MTQQELVQDSKAHPRQGQRLAAKFAEAERLVRLSPVGREAYVRLSVLRARLAVEAKVPAYQIFSNHLLLELSERRPLDEGGLAGFPNFGNLRLKAYGAEVLAVLRGLEDAKIPVE